MEYYHYWFISALLMLILEFLTGTFFLLIIACALLIGGLLCWLGSSGVIASSASALSGLIGVLILNHYKRKINGASATHMR